MNEEQAVLDFFAQAENLPLALSVADQVDATRQQLNQSFWLTLREHMTAKVTGWAVKVTEDRNAADCLVGLNLELAQHQPLFLRPMFEQQYLGNALRIYFGLMWSAPPSPEATQLSAVIALRDTLQTAGFKNNANFLAWQWTAYHPRRKDFLLRFSTTKDVLLDEVAALMQDLLITHADALNAANAALHDAPQSVPVSLDNLRSNLR